jgi:hypothetical protein
MNDPNYPAQNFKGPTIRLPPRARRGGPRTIYLTETVKYEIPDYGYPDDDDDDVVPDTTKYPIGPSGRPIAGSKRVARHREHGSPISAGKMLQSINAHPALASNSFEVRLNHRSGFVFQHSCSCLFYKWC